MNKHIAFSETRAQARSIGSCRERSRATYAVRSPVLGLDHPVAAVGPKAPHKKTPPASAWDVLVRARAQVVHSTTSRLRLKVPSHRHDDGFFAGLRQKLLEQRGILSVEVNPMTASVLIMHDGVLDLHSEQRHAGRNHASRAYFAAGRSMGEPLSRDADLAWLAVKLALAAILQQPSSLFVELCADALAQVVGVSVLSRLAHPGLPRQSLLVRP